MKPTHAIGMFVPGRGRRSTTILRARWCVTLVLLLCNWVFGFASEAAESDRLLNIFTREEGGITHFYAQNLAAGTVTTTFEMKLENMASTTPFPYTTNVAANQALEVFTLSPIKKGAVARYRCVNSATLGSAAAVHDDAHIYDLPYAPGSTFRVSQGYHGSFSHTGPDEYAIDWAMPVGTPVCAARGGVVVKSKDDEDKGGRRRRYQTHANCILIEHSDGTIGVYGHLAKGGNKVKVGDRVKAGDVIGTSGKTGFVEGPHLHFAVFKTRNGSERVSLPVKFRTTDSMALTLVSGQEYTAPVRGEQVRNDAPLTAANQQESRAGGDVAAAGYSLPIFSIAAISAIANRVRISGSCPCRYRWPMDYRGWLNRLLLLWEPDQWNLASRSFGCHFPKRRGFGRHSPPEGRRCQAAGGRD